MAESIRASRLVLLGVAALLAVHFAIAVASKRHASTTSDELAHLTAGFAYWEFDDYRLQPENGNLPQRWGALPAWLMDTKFPSLTDNEYWRLSDVWVLGHMFFYETGDDHFPRLMLGRAAVALFSVATGALVFVWSRRLFGTAGGFVSLMLYAFCPNFLAHGALVTSDVCLVFFMLASVGAYWRHLHQPGFGPWALSAVVFGFACVSKYSAVLLPPIMIVLAGLRAMSREPLVFVRHAHTTRGRRVVALLASLLGHGAVAIAVIWTFYGFRYAVSGPDVPAMKQFIRSWESVVSRIGWHGTMVEWLAAWRALPEAFLYGYAYVIESVIVRSSFLDGEYSMTGWTRFFPLAFLYKSTLPLMIGCAAAAGVVIHRWRRAAAGWPAVRGDLYRVAPLIALFAIYWLSSLTTRLNIGHRHLLPTYPVLFIFCGALGTWLCQRSFARLSVALLLLWQGAAAVRTYPYYIAYFNEAVGGPENGYRHLVDRSLDWGQDLPGLKRWIATNAAPGEPVYLSYFGNGEPRYYGIEARRLVFLNGFKLPPPPLAPLEAGVYCIGATMLQHVYSPVRGPWTLELEREFQAARASEEAMIDFSRRPERREELLREARREKWESATQRYEWLRLARLCYYLRARGPDANVGYSILIYRLSADELRTAAHGSLQDWQQAIEQAVQRKHSGKR